MIELQKQGRYDKAIQVMHRWLTDSRRDPSHDSFMLNQIAIIYLIKAWNRPASRDEAIRDSAMTLQKELEWITKNGFKENDIDLYDVGRVYEELGNLSSKDKCEYYEQARQAYVKQLPLIKGESETEYGHTFQLEPIRTEIKKHLGAVDVKYSESGCAAQTQN